MSTIEEAELAYQLVNYTYNYFIVSEKDTEEGFIAFIIGFFNMEAMSTGLEEEIKREYNLLKAS